MSQDFAAFRDTDNIREDKKRGCLEDMAIDIVIKSLLISFLFFCFLILVMIYIEKNLFISSDEILQSLYKITIKNDKTSLIEYKNNFNLDRNEKVMTFTIDPIRKRWWRDEGLKILSILKFKSVEDIRLGIKDQLIRELNIYPWLNCYHGFDRKTIQCDVQPDFDLAISSKDTFPTWSELIQQTVPSIVLQESVKRLDDKECSILTKCIDWMVYLDPLENEEVMKKLISLAQKKNISMLIHFVVRNENEIDEVIKKYKNSNLLTNEEKKRLNKNVILHNNFIAFKYGIKKLPFVLTLTFNNGTKEYEYKQCKNCL